MQTYSAQDKKFILVGAASALSRLAILLTNSYIHCLFLLGRTHVQLLHFSRRRQCLTKVSFAPNETMNKSRFILSKSSLWKLIQNQQIYSFINMHLHWPVTFLTFPRLQEILSTDWALEMRFSVLSLMFSKTDVCEGIDQCRGSCVAPKVHPLGVQA
jgi:hypothetical protein